MLQNITQVDKKVRLYIGLKGGTQKVLRLTDSKQYAEANWFEPDQAIELLAYIKEITAKDSKVVIPWHGEKVKAAGLPFDSIYSDEFKQNKGEVYIGYFMKGTQKRGVQMRRASTGTAEEKQSKATPEVEII